ncbi:MAG: hypothetical protein K2L38_01225, partial [Dysosmobacter sp.]|nr:hypothetical protein [Dysosmobacter sp.]
MTAERTQQRALPGFSLALYGAAHFWVDFSCALLVFGALAGDPAFPLCVYNLRAPQPKAGGGWGGGG